MRIVYLTAGAGGTICGNCLRDNALAAALQAQGHDVVLLPIYTPLRTDEVSVAAHDVYMGGVNLYLGLKYPWAAKLPSFVHRLLDSPALLRHVSRLAVKTLPEDLGAMTVATLRGEDGPIAAEIAPLIKALKQLEPDVVHLTNTMLAGLAPPIKRELGIPIIASLQGEDYFLSNLPDPYSAEAFAVLRVMADSIDVFSAPCRDHAKTMAPLLGRKARDIVIVPPGIAVDDFSPREPRDPAEFVVGYLARIAPEKGLHLLVDAVRHIRDHEKQGMPPVRLRVAGWLSPEYEEYLRGVEDKVRQWDLTDRFECLRYIDRPSKVEFLRSLDAFCVPTTYGAPKGLYVLEAWACGVPCVQPDIGVFPELTETTGGGLLFEPRNYESLVVQLLRLRDRPAEAAKLGERGRQGTLQHYTAAKMAAATFDLYRTLTHA